MRLMSWNVNGIRAAVSKGFVPLVEGLNCDVICLQETKAQDDQVITALEELQGFHIYPNSAVKKAILALPFLPGKSQYLSPMTWASIFTIRKDG